MIIAARMRLGTRGQPKESRAAILKAAVREFAQEGVAGARTDAIARRAGVNKALLYYYFKDKETLYQAVLDQVFGGLRAAIHDALAQDVPPREKLASYVGAHFDYIASNPFYPRIVQAEMMRAGRGEPSRMPAIARQYFRPLFLELSTLLRAGAEAGQFRVVDPLHFIPSMISVIVFHFNAAPVFKFVTGSDPMSAENLAARRKAVLEFISAALFTERKAGPE